jgi:hypothetical protein
MVTETEGEKIGGVEGCQTLAEVPTTAGLGTQAWRGTLLPSLRAPSNLVTSWAGEAATRVLTCLTNQGPDAQNPGRARDQTLTSGQAIGKSRILNYGTCCAFGSWQATI